MSTCGEDAPITRTGPVFDGECLHGATPFSDEIAVVVAVFTKELKYFTSTIPLNTDTKYLDNFVKSFERRPCKIGANVIVEQTILHFLCKESIDANITRLSGISITQLKETVDHLYNLFVLNTGKFDSDKTIDTYKRQIKNLKVHDNNGNLVSVLDFKSFVDGKTVIEIASCKTDNAGNRYHKLIKIVESIKKVEDSDDDDDVNATWRDVDPCKDNNLKYQAGDKLVLNDLLGTTFNVEGCNKDGYIEYIREDPITKRPITKIHPETTISRKAMFRGGKKTKRSSFRYKKRASKSKKLRKRNKR